MMRKFPGDPLRGRLDPINQKKYNDMETTKEICIALLQIVILLALYPFWLILGAWARFTQRDKFRCLTRVAGMYIFPAWGRWWLPMLWI